MTVYDFRAFVDDSGNDPREPQFILAAWIGTAQEWEYFTEDWANRLKEEPSIDYFKHNEAMAAKKCFQGFSKEDVNQKAYRLVSIITRHNIYGAVVTLKHQDHQKVFQAGMPKGKGVYRDFIKDPLYICFNDIIPVILQLHIEKGFEGKIDFIFDGDKKRRSGSTSRCIAIYEFVKGVFREQGHPFYQLMGSVVSGDDKEILPLQAADLLAGQVRLYYLNGCNMSPALKAMTAKKRIIHHDITPEYMAENLVTPFNAMCDKLLSDGEETEKQ